MVDIYPCRLVATRDGRVASEGEVFVRVSPGPHEREGANLLVPVCLSGTHVALASVRMEPTYMVLGESAGIAAVRALEERVSVQAIDSARLRRALVAAGQILQWDGFGYGDRSPIAWTGTASAPGGSPTRKTTLDFRSSASAKARAATRRGKAGCSNMPRRSSSAERTGTVSRWAACRESSCGELSRLITLRMESSSNRIRPRP